MKREIFHTADGSTTIHLIDWDEHYHSKHGAIQEANHVFIKNGLAQVSLDKFSILEIGFGTGLNAFITYLEAQKTSKIIDCCSFSFFRNSFPTTNLQSIFIFRFMKNCMTMTRNKIYFFS